MLYTIYDLRALSYAGSTYSVYLTDYGNPQITDKSNHSITATFSILPPGVSW
jgi:hypothetical protein